MDENKKNTKIERIKKHIKDNKKVYIAGATGVAAGVCGTLIYCLATGKFHKTTITNQGVGTNLGITNVIQQTVSEYGNKLGRPGNEVVDTQTWKCYKSQTLAAKAAGVSDTSMSRHLNGDYPNLDGRTFKRLSDMWYNQ